MKTLSIFIFVIIKVSMCCEDGSNINILPPFHNVQNIQLNVGDDLILVCCHPDGAENLSWLDKSNNPISFKDINGLISLMDEKDRLILKIDNIDKKKIGKYTCINSKRTLSKSISVVVRDSPLITKKIPIMLYLPSNKPIQIKCPLDANQGFKMWYFMRGDKKIIVTKPSISEAYEVNNDRTIFTVKTDSKNINVIWCHFQEVALNGDINMASYELTWKIYDPIDVQVVIDHKGPILESNDVKLICYFRYDESLSISIPYNKIMKPNFKVDDKDVKKGKVVLWINKITKDLEGEYECRISRFLDHAPLKVVEESAKVKVDVIIGPKIISNDFVTSSTKLGENAYLSCQIKGKQLGKDTVYFEKYFPANSSWIKISAITGKYDVNLTINEINILTLLIKNVTWEDSGEYKCVANNAAGEDYKTGMFMVEKPAELKSSTNLIYMATKTVYVNCSVLGYPLSDWDTVELRMVSKYSPVDLNLIGRRKDLVDGLSVSYEVVFKRELTEGSTYKLECYYNNTKNNISQQKEIELRMATKPDVPDVSIVCSGSSGIAFRYKESLSGDENKKIVKTVLSYAPSEVLYSLTTDSSKVIPINDGEQNENVIYVLKDLVASRKYNFKWESFNRFGLSNEKSLSYSTKDVAPPQPPKTLQFSPKGNMISVNLTWTDECPYSGSNSDIRDIVVTMKPFKTNEGPNYNWQWTERNFTIEWDKSSAQFQLYLENPQIDYEIKVALRSSQGTSESLTEVYTASVVLTGSLFSCFPRCSGNTLSSCLSLILFACVMSKLIQ